MAELYQQFLGTTPGMVVELVDDSASPFLVRSEDGFTFLVSGDDFRNYYRKVNETTPRRWKPFVTDAERGLVESAKMARVMDLVHSFEGFVGDFDKARSWVRDALGAMTSGHRQDWETVRRGLAERGWDSAAVPEAELERLAKLPADLRSLLLEEAPAAVPFTGLLAGPNGDEGPPVRARRSAAQESPEQAGAPAKKKPAKPRLGSMKNVDLSVDGDLLTIKVDLSCDFGPSKSGKTMIVASTQGNKTVPGREEKIGLNVYRQEAKKPSKGRRSEFKNVVMAVDGDALTVSVDLSKEFGASKSGQTTIIASTEGNQLVFGREEKIGLNVYRKNE